MSTQTDLLGMVKIDLSQKIEQANSIAARVAASKAGTGNLVHEIALELPTDDATITKTREWLDKVDVAREAKMAELYEYVKANAMPSGDGEVDVEALTVEYKALKASISAGQSFVKVSVPDADLSDLPELKSLRGGTVGKSGAAGDTKRPRIAAIWCDGEAITAKNGKGEDVSNLSVLATYLSKRHDTKVEVKDLQMHTFAAAGTDDLKTLDGKVFTFSVNVGDQSHTIKVQPSIPKSAEKVETEATPAA